MTHKENMEVPLRVRISTAEDERLKEAMLKLGLTKSTYVRWAIANSTAQVLGTVMSQPQMVQVQQAPAKPKRVRVVAPPAEPEAAPVPSVESFFAPQRDGEPYVPEPGDPVVPDFDGADWT